MNIEHDGTIDIATGNSRKAMIWTNKNIKWSDLLRKISTPNPTTETFQQYMTANKSHQDEIKDVGGFVGGYLVGGRRKAGNVKTRQLLTLDVDFGKLSMWEDFKMIYDNAAALYTTHKHCPDNHRFRLLIPLDRPVLPDEYEAIGRRVAGILGIDSFDPTTFEPSRLMYWPSTSIDGEYIFDHQDGPWLSADNMLSSYKDWRNREEWPVCSKEHEIVVRSAIKKKGDPLTKPGIIGAFCRTYTIQGAISEYLDEIYGPGDITNRYTYIPGSTSNGVIIYEDKYSYSHHGTDPVGGKLCNAFDLVRLHLFGPKDEDCQEGTPVVKRPSYLAMEDLATKDPEVRKQLGRERLQEVDEDFKNGVTEIKTDWLAETDIDRKGKLLTTVKNIRLILENDTRLRHRIVFNELSQKLEVQQPMPWNKETKVRTWNDDDWGCLRCYLGEDPYCLARSPKLEDVMSIIRVNNRYHPIRNYLSGLHWDGKERVNTLLIDYLGAEDSPYVQAVTRKTLVAAIARIFQPGIKFDNVLTLVGKQGIGKSTIIKKLGKDWYSDTFSFNMLQSKEAFELIQGFWLIEIGEMVGLKTADIEGAKRFLTSTEDNYRPAYGREVVSRPRQCVFLGTTNNYDFLRKANGNRRFWVVDLGEQPITKDLFENLTDYEVDQIWAEAVSLHRVGENLHLSRNLEEMAFRIQENHTEHDDRHGMIEAYLDTMVPENWETMDTDSRRAYVMGDALQPKGTRLRGQICVAEIWCELLGHRFKDMNGYNTKDLHAIMRNMPGWAQAKANRLFKIYGKQRAYYRVENVPIQESLMR